MRSIDSRSFLILSLVICEIVTASAGHEQYKCYRCGDSLLGKRKLAVCDQYNGLQNNFKVKESYVNVHFRYEDALRNFIPGIRKWKLNYDIRLYSPQNDSTDRTNQSIEVYYSDTGKYTDKSVNSYNNSLRASLRVLSIEITNIQNGNTVTNTYTPDNNCNLPADLFFELELNMERYYELPLNSVNVYIPALAMNTNAECVETSMLPGNTLPIAWNYIEGAESYDVEWLFIDCPDTLQNTNSTSHTYDFINATSINTTMQNYNISMAYPRGLLLFRVRPVGVDISNNFIRKEGAWSIPLSKGVLSQVRPWYILRYCGLDAGMNWQYMASYAEEGKRKELITYFDGTMRPRQEVTLLNTDSTALVGETVYDGMGRPAVKILSAPTDSKGICFYRNNNGMFNGSFSKANFDGEAKINNPDALNTGGAALYFSTSNPYMELSHPNSDDYSRYTPDAQGYAYSQIRYMNDGTDRVKSQSIPGAMFKLGFGHEVKNLYGRPGSQKELDRLFGNEAGFVNHYKKNIVVDQNGQSSVAYLDGTGKTIATCLSGSTPGNVLDLDRKPAPDILTSNLLDDNHLTADNKMLSKSVLMPTASTEYHFHYSLGSAGYCHPFCIGCTDCRYRQNIIINDDEENRVIWHKYNILMTSGRNFDTTITLTPGTYTIVKTMEVDDSTSNALGETYRNHIPACLDTAISPAPCTYTCEEMCENSYPIYDSAGLVLFSYFDGNHRVISQDTVVLRHNLINQCIQTQCPLTSEFDACEIRKRQLILDMSPRGQYFDNRYIVNSTTGERTNTVNNDWLLYHIPNAAFNSFFLDSSGILSLYSNTPNGHNDAWNYIRTHWYPIYGEWLLLFHPEYCTYYFQCEYHPVNLCKVYDNINYHPFPDIDDYRQYDSLMQTVNDDIRAEAYHLFNPLGSEINVQHSGPYANDTAYVSGQPPDLKRCLVGTDSCRFPAGDPFFRHCTGNLYPIVIYPGFNNSFNPIQRMWTYLRNFVTTISARYSIWYVLDDPDNIATVYYQNIDTNIVNMFRYLHNMMFKPVVNGGLGMSKFMFFKGVYTFFKKKILADIYDHSSGAINNFVYCDTGYYLPSHETDIGYLTNDNKFNVHFIRDTLLGLYSSNLTAMNNFIVSQTANLCDTNCNSYADWWMDQFTCNLSSADTVGLRQYLIKICIAGCDLAHPQGNDTALVNHPVRLAGTSTWLENFTDVVNSFAGNLNCNVPVHPSAINPLDTNLIHPYGSIQDYQDSVLAHCIRHSAMIAERQRQRILETRYRDSVNNLIAKYRGHCYNSLARIETFNMHYELNEYYYTLYYYDRAGNLIKTVPPEGVHVIRGSDSLDAIKTYRETYGNGLTRAGFILPHHRKVSIYRFNSLEMPIAQRSPDAGLTTTWYDRHGRVVLLQNAKQLPDRYFTYNTYDAQGRVVETGQIKDAVSSGPDEDYIIDSTEQHALNNMIRISSKEQVVHTFYDTVFYVIRSQHGLNKAICISGFEQENVRNRISSVTYYNNLSNDLSKYNTALHYDYDVHGNVRALIQDIPLLRNFNRQYMITRYDYDLVSGKVNKAAFQTGLPEQFYHRYDYDADNRITHVFTSRDGFLWDNDAKYFYYKHGPLARIELGDKQVQGTDYAYTLQGWMKRININDTLSDLGYDGDTIIIGNPNKDFALDAYRFLLNYYNSDYLAVKTNGFIYPQTPGFTSLYNGNIAQTYNKPDIPFYILNNAPARNFTNFAAYTYQYDQLNRLKNTNAVAGNRNINNFMLLSYDRDGNIDSLKRKTLTGSGSFMDKLKYQYYPNKNRLKQVSDNIAANNFATDIDNQTDVDNYQYDNIGNLTKDKSERVDLIDWTLFGKLWHVRRTPRSDKTNLEFLYDPMGNRMVKLAYNCDIPGNEHKAYSIYARDAQGNIMATYTLKYYTYSNKFILLADGFPIYGSNRLGVLNTAITADKQSNLPDISTTAVFYISPYDVPTYSPVLTINGWALPVTPYNPKLTKFNRTLGSKSYELTDHLGNVTVTLSDRKIAEHPLHNQNTVTYYFSEVKSTQDYYPFGQIIESRSSAAYKYRFGFNGQEKDDDIKGNGDINTALFWEYDTRLGRRWNVDPKMNTWESPYACFGNNPIHFSDVLGDTKEERDKAAKKAKEYKERNPGKSYKNGGMGEPGEGVDCSGMVRKCIMASGLSDPTKGSKGDGKWTNGVALLVNSPSTRETTIGAARIGDIITLDTERGIGDKGEYDHTGIITNVFTNDKGVVTGFTFIHSGSSGPTEATYNSGGKGYWDDRVRGVYQWDTPDDKPVLKNKNSQSVQDNAILIHPSTNKTLSIPK